MDEAFTMTRTTSSNALELGPHIEMPSTNSDHLKKSPEVVRHKRSDSELNVDRLALLASTVIAEWDYVGQHNYQRKKSALKEMRSAS